MDYLDLSTLALDTGLLVLIWLVQRIVYPAFHVVEAEGFQQWHEDYTRRMGGIVIPLMFGQLGCHIALTWMKPESLLGLLAFASVLTAWVLTFAGAVPLHRRLGSQGKNDDVIDRLLRVNTARTLAWTLTWVFTAARLVIGAFAG